MLDEWELGGGHPSLDLGAGAGVGGRGSPGGDLFALDHRAGALSRGLGVTVAFTVVNDTLFVATSRNFLLRHDLSDDGGGASPVVELEATKSSDARVRRLFVDPLGRHALLALQTPAGLETHYVDGGLKRARPLPKLRGLSITSVAWSPALRAGGFSEALLGTDSGALYELALEPEGKKETLRLLYELRGETGPVAGLAQVELSTQRRLVLALCGTRLYAFAGGPSLEAVFAPGGGAGEGGGGQGAAAAEPRCIDLPTQSGAAQLQLLYPPRQPDASLLGDTAAPPFRMPSPEVFAVLSPSGIYYGQLDLDPSIPDPSDHLVKHQLLPAAVLHLPPGGGNGGAAAAAAAAAAADTPGERPLSLAMTQHHFVLLYPSKLQWVNRVSKAAVQELPLQRFATPVRGAATMPLGLCRDQLAGRIYVLAGDDALEVDASGEDRDMWRILLDKGEYRQALTHCRGAAQRNTVYLAEAAALFEEGQYVQSAALYGKVTSSVPSFEDVALRFMETGDPDAVAAFLQSRLDTLGRDDKAQATMVATWLTELLLDQLNRALLQPDAAGEAGGSDGAADGSYQQAVERLRAFLQRYVEVLDPGTTIGLLAGYGRLEELMYYARCRGDWESLLEYLLQRGEAEKALEVLRRPSVSPELYYKFAPALVAQAPELTVQAWMDVQPPLEPRRLLPALLHFGDPGGTAAGRAEALKYVRFCWLRLGSEDPAVHNLAVALLSLDASQEEQLLEYLASARSLSDRPLYDPVHALRLARERRRLRASVALFCEVGMWEDAVSLALSFDSELAASIARQPSGDEALSRKLWLSIARHMIEDSSTPEPERIRGVTALLEAAGGAVRIEDILPLFPDFVEIDAFKDAICSSLEAYNREIEELKGEMQNATTTVQAIREDLARLEHRSAALDSAEPCARCGRPLHAPPPGSAGPSGGSLPKLFLFPTGNAFHGSCLCAEAAELAPTVQRRRIRQLAERLAAVPEGSVTAPATPDAPAASVETLRQQLEEEVAGDDPFEGEAVVRHLSRPFVQDREEEESWRV
ncbi:vacuolar sorting-associated 18-like protein [Micractinium conductrix]|uniref:Vacuolar sorting-associated 18-like protein n=1 Tax=Micractinium conductrix TaxID=554055 RepID=A0A2P6VGU8_9CHLO|nr:vacuolar sorting-associated 18-like protein [Micractinium conductrix]|eukprot:PSC73297.1 vacuolar sorting-associated 18-like protein [Micractinium conductrix]